MLLLANVPTKIDFIPLALKGLITRQFQKRESPERAPALFGGVLGVSPKQKNLWAGGRERRSFHLICPWQTENQMNAYLTTENGFPKLKRCRVLSPKRARLCRELSRTVRERVNVAGLENLPLFNSLPKEVRGFVRYFHPSWRPAKSLRGKIPLKKLPSHSSDHEFSNMTYLDNHYVEMI